MRWKIFLGSTSQAATRTRPFRQGGSHKGLEIGWIRSEHLKGEKKEAESWCWNDETMRDGGLRLQGIVFSSLLEALSLPLSSLRRPHGTRLAKGQKIISTGHELEISSWGRIPFLIRVEGRKSQGSFLLLRQRLGGGCQKLLPGKKLRLFKNEIKVVG